MTQGSDQLRLYDVSGGYLRLRLQFQPRTGNRGWSDGISVPLGKMRSGFWDYGLEHLRLLDLFGNGEHELVGDYSAISAASTGSGPYELPVVMFWDDIAQRYRIIPLLSGAPGREPGFSLDPGVSRRFELRDASTTTLQPFATDAYAITPPAGSSPARLTIADDTAPDRHGDIDVIVEQYTLTPSASGIDVSPIACRPESVVTNQNLTESQIVARAAGSGRGLRLAPINAACTG